jgi:hypothetical protein
MNLREIVARLKLKHKIVKGTKRDEYIVYMVIEDNVIVGYPATRPAFDYEIDEVQDKERKNDVKEMLKTYKAKKQRKT